MISTALFLFGGITILGLLSACIGHSPADDLEEKRRDKFFRDWY